MTRSATRTSSARIGSTPSIEFESKLAEPLTLAA